MKKQCKTFKRNCRCLRAGFRHAIVAMLLLLFSGQANSQCDVTSTVVDDDMVFSIVTPGSGTYAWTATYTTPGISPVTGSGTTFNLPFLLPLPNEFTVSVAFTPSGIGTGCTFTADVKVDAACGELTGFNPSIDGCEVDFNSFGNGFFRIIGTIWDFGDGTTSTAEDPSHAYDCPGGIFDVSLWTVLYNGTSSPKLFQFFKCEQEVETECLEIDTVCELGVEMP